MAKVKSVYGDKSSVTFDITEMTAPDPNDIWVQLDRETDSVTIYVTGRPLPGVHVYVGDDTYVIVDNESRPIGFYIEAWERRYVPAHPQIQDVWEQIRPTIPVEDGWNSLLRLLALWLVMLHSQIDSPNPPDHLPQRFQPA